MEDDILLISDYLAGHLSEEARKQAEERLSQDKTFAELHADQVRQLIVLQAGARAEAKAELHQAFNTYRQSRQRNRRIWMSTSIAASVAFLLLFLIQPWQSAPTAEQLAMSYLDPFPAQMERGFPDDSSLQVLQDSALLLYRAGKYDAAIPMFKELLLQTPADQGLQLYLAESLSHTGQYADAAVLLEELSSSQLYGDAATWRRALNLVLAGEHTKASRVLQGLESSSHYKSPEAKILLERLSE